jgi:hypothetical protein
MFSDTVNIHNRLILFKLILEEDFCFVFGSVAKIMFSFKYLAVSTLRLPSQMKSLLYLSLSLADKC